MDRRIAKFNLTWARARRDKLYIGMPCTHGHLTRYVSNKKCVACKSAHNKAGIEGKRRWREEHADQESAREKRYRDADPRRVSFARIPYRAQARGVPCSFKAANGLPPCPNQCPGCGVPFQRGVGSACGSTPTIDRIVPALGYVPNNVQWLCLSCNSSKQ